MIYNDLCNYMRPKGRCEYKEKGYNRKNCPFLGTGIFANLPPFEASKVDNFYTKSNLKIYQQYRNNAAQYIVKNINNRDAQNYWCALAKTYNLCSQIKESFETMAVLLSGDSTIEEKAFSKLKYIYDLEHPLDLQDKNLDKKIVAHFALDLISSYAKIAIKATNFYKEASNKGFITVGIDVLKIITGQAMDKMLDNKQ